jgi:hypothetical protein
VNAEAEAILTEIRIFKEISQLPSNLTGRALFVIIHEAKRISLFISVIPEEANNSMSERFTILKCFLNFAFEKPLNLGILLNSGV